MGNKPELSNSDRHEGPLFDPSNPEYIFADQLAAAPDYVEVTSPGYTVNARHARIFPESHLPHTGDYLTFAVPLRSAGVPLDNDYASWIAFPPAQIQIDGKPYQVVYQVGATFFEDSSPYMWLKPIGYKAPQEEGEVVMEFGARTKLSNLPIKTNLFKPEKPIDVNKPNSFENPDLSKPINWNDFQIKLKPLDGPTLNIPVRDDNKPTE